MTDQVLDILKLGLLALLYLFFVRVLWAVWSEVRSPAPAAGVALSRLAPARSAPVATPKRVVPSKLVIVEPAARSGTTFEIGGGVPIGRDVETGIRITDDSFVSGRHAHVSNIDGEVIVRDLKSRNGTFVNGARVANQVAVTVGDRVQIGYTVLEAR